MNVLRRTMALLFVLASISGAWADGYRSVFVTHTNGTTTHINLRQDLQTEFSASKISFFGGGVEVVFERSEVASFTFSQVVGINQLEANGENMPVVNGRSLSLSNLPDGSDVIVRAADGRKVAERKVSGSCELSLSGLPAGTYVVSINGMSYKFIVKK